MANPDNPWPPDVPSRTAIVVLRAWLRRYGLGWIERCLRLAKESESDKPGDG